MSKFPQLHLGAAVTEKFVLALDGQRDKTRESVEVQFSQLGLTTNDLQAARAFWPEKSFTGRWLDADGVTLQPIEERIGVFDTADQDEWSDELRQHVEEWMLRKPNYGTDFIRAEAAAAAQPVLAPPWRTYDETHHFRIPKLAAELQVVEEALAYERATKNRPGVIESLEAVLRGPEPDPEPAEGELIAA